MMKKLTILLAFAFALVINASAQTDYVSRTELNELHQKLLLLETKLQQVESAHAEHVKRLNASIDSLKRENQLLRAENDSLRATITALTASHNNDHNTFTQGLEQTQSSIATTNTTVSSRTTWAAIIIALVVTIVAIVVALIIRRLNSGASSIDKVRAAQEKMQEESVSLDNKLIALIDKQMGAHTLNQTTATGEMDHSLALKVADEIVRIETNLSRMDPAVKGYKQLSKAVQRIKDNFRANGYEIADMLGQPYNPGMKVIADFVPNEDLEKGQQIITGITKPQILYNGQLIQAAQITVSQNI